MSLAGDVLTNYNNVFILLKTDSLFKFKDEGEMRAFMKYQFPNPATAPSSAYCLQQPAQPKVFQCLLIYSSGVPNLKFDVTFDYNKNGKSGHMKLEVDPLSNGFASRSLL